MSNQKTQLRRAVLALLLALAATSLHACTDACTQLAKEVCLCLPDDGTRATCNQEASDNSDVFPVGDDDAAYCQKLLDTHACDCNQLTTPAVKANCGLSYPTE
jgi:hypothetical protein